MAQVNTSTGTYLSSLFNPQVVADLIDTKLTDNMVFAPLAKIDYTLQGRAGNTVTLPYYSYIGAASAVSEGYDIGIRKLTQSTSSVTIVKYGVAVQLTDEAVLSGYGNPIGEAAMQITTAIDDAMDNALLAALAANSASEQNYSTSSALAPEDIPLALAKFGEDNDGPKSLLVTPDFYAQLIGQPATSNWVPASEIAAEIKIRGAVGMAYGCQVVVTNRLKTSGNLYIVKPNTLAVFIKRGAMVETDRDILNQSTVLAGSILCAPYLLNPTGMIKLAGA
ncbi:MAG: N4-gp56 family major capsid protein [Bacteroidales bacterium]|nr:N4-gp56 family major capsid protein [Bacteroidales bacterium]